MKVKHKKNKCMKGEKVGVHIGKREWEKTPRQTFIFCVKSFLLSKSVLSVWRLSFILSLLFCVRKKLSLLSVSTM